MPSYHPRHLPSFRSPNTRMDILILSRYPCLFFLWVPEEAVSHHSPAFFWSQLLQPSSNARDPLPRRPPTCFKDPTSSSIYHPTPISWFLLPFLPELKPAKLTRLEEWSRKRSGHPLRCHLPPPLQQTRHRPVITPLPIQPRSDQ